jgi:hypothetical protein
VALAASLGLFSGSASATPITVANFSFETPGTNNGGAGCPITGWTCSTNSSSMGVYVPVTTQFPSGANGLSGGAIVPDGTQAAYLALTNGFISQNTAALIANSTTYTLSVFVGRRNDFNPAISGSIALTNNGTVFATLAMSAPAQGQWLDETVSYTTTLADSLLFGGTLGIRITDLNGNQLNVDDVRLSQSTTTVTDVPEPATLGLFGLGLAAVGVARRKRRAA